MNRLFKLIDLLSMGVLIGFVLVWGLSYWRGVYTKSFTISANGHDFHGRTARYAMEQGRLFI